MRQRNRNLARLALCAGVLIALAWAVSLEDARLAAQRGGGNFQDLRRQFSEQMEASLAEPFRGITSNGTPERGLFAITATGVSTEPARRATQAFLDSLTMEQRARTAFAIDDVEWRKWANQDVYIRQGVSFLEMSDAQREKAFELLRASLSAKGLTQTRDIMRLNHTLGELSGNLERYGEWQYHLTVMGTPSASEPWGWQFDGHHGIINYFVLGDQIVMTPFFAGSEPAIAHGGKYKGTAVLQEEQNSGLALVRALPAELQQQAILNGTKRRPSNLTEAFKDNVVLDYQGLRATAMPQAQREQLLDLIALHVGAMPTAQQRIKMQEVRRHLDRTTFAWIGETGDDSVFYYRIQSPVVLIEFDHQPPVGLPSPPGVERDVPNREHIHVVVRTPNGNDYGKDLLRQHYERHRH